MNNHYEENGYIAFRDMFEEAELREVRAVILKFHQTWMLENAKFYTEQAINSAYLTSPKYLSDSERESLFKFISSAKLMRIVTSIMGDRPAFMNTQLFFNPSNDAQKNYWHRDPQYHLSVAEQKKALSGSNVLHFRIPLSDEPGLELVPGTHKRWDTNEELNVRLEKNGHKNHEDLSTGKTIPINTGDLLVFNANMIHRGIYGMDRLSLDILFCDPVPELLQFADDDCLPDLVTLEKLENIVAFNNTIEIRSNINAMKTPSA